MRKQPQRYSVINQPLFKKQNGSCHLFNRSSQFQQDGATTHTDFMNNMRMYSLGR